jgi:hypothetical protein
MLHVNRADRYRKSEVALYSAIMRAAKRADNRSGIVTVVCLMVAALAVFGEFDSYRAAVAYNQQFPDAYFAGRAQIRFAQVLSRFPTSAQLGYITDLEPSGAYSAAFLAAQYALAPRQLLMLGPQTRPEWALGNFTKPLDFVAAGAAQGYEPSSDLGNGVVLFRRKGLP